MSKVLVVYWSGTGNTQAMAEAVAAGAKEAGAEVTLTDVSGAGAVADYEYIAFGCPSMGDEVLEESEMEPFFTEAEGKLSGKKVALFGSYDWGDGQWMRDWTKRTSEAGAQICGGEGLIVNNTPDDNGLAECKKLGAALAGM